MLYFLFFFSSRRRHPRCSRDWSSDVCSSDLTHWTGCARSRPPLSAFSTASSSGGGVGTPGARRSCGRTSPPRSASGGPIADQIGRGSGRERGEISGGAGSFKKKKEEQRYGAR